VAPSRLPDPQSHLTTFLPIARFRRQVSNLLHEPLWWTVRRLDSRFGGTDNQSERTMEILLRDKPAHFLNPKFNSYDGLLDEAASYLHTPAGQSRHFLSAFYRNSHPAWMQGKATLLLGLPPRHRLILRAAR
jgi:hypothetical protein